MATTTTEAITIAGLEWEMVLPRSSGCKRSTAT
jgi:hypothetical protein